MSSICLFIPVFFLELPLFLHFSILQLIVYSFIYHNYPCSITKTMNYANIVNVCSYVYFQSPISVYFVLFYILEQYYVGTNIIKNITYFLTYSKFSHVPLVNLFFWYSLIIYINSKYNHGFLWYERWIWHFCQGMYMYYCLSTLYPLRFVEYITF